LVWSLRPARATFSLAGRLSAGRRYGEVLILGPGRHVGLTAGHLRLANRFFERWGLFAVFAGRLLPVIRTYISFPAGLSRITVVPFTLATIGRRDSLESRLAYAGFQTGPELRTGGQRARSVHIPLAVLVLVAIVVAYYYGRRIGEVEGPASSESSLRAMGEQEPTLLSSLDLASVRTVLADEFPWLPLHSLKHPPGRPHPVPHSRRRNNRMVDHPGARGGQRRVPISLSTNRQGRTSLERAAWALPPITGTHDPGDPGDGPHRSARGDVRLSDDSGAPLDTPTYRQLDDSEQLLVGTAIGRFLAEMHTALVVTEAAARLTGEPLHPMVRSNSPTPLPAADCG